MYFLLVMSAPPGEYHGPAKRRVRSAAAGKKKILLIPSLTPGVVLQLYSGRIKATRITQLIPESRIRKCRLKSDMMQRE